MNNFEKVNNFMIMKLNLFFMTKLNDEIVEAMVEDLGEFSSEILQSAFLQIRRTCKKIPSLSEIIDICNQIKTETKKSTNENKPKVKKFPFITGKAEIEQPHQVKEILSTQIGQSALKLGVALALVVEYEKTGQKEFTKSFVEKQRASLQEGAELLGAVKDNPLNEMLTNLYNSMREREINLYKQFYFN